MVYKTDKNPLANPESPVVEQSWVAEQQAAENLAGEPLFAEWIDNMADIGTSEDVQFMLDTYIADPSMSGPLDTNL